MTGEVNHRADAPAIVVMGVSASGKSTVAAALAEGLGVPWEDADDLHPRTNVEKMASGTPLTDADRWPWLAAVGHRLQGGAVNGGLIIACSALRRVYRDRLRQVCPQTVFVHLSGSRELLAARARERTEHFMPPGLLDSQFATLEPLQHDEPGVTVNVDAPIGDIVEQAEQALSREGWIPGS